MTDDRFERNLRAFVRSRAPDDVPAGLRERAAAVTDEPVPRMPWLEPTLRVVGGLALVAVLLMAFAILRPFGVPTGEGGPSPSLISAYIEQTDGAFGYAMERPAGWQATDLATEGRQYASPGFGTSDDWVTITVNNYQVAAAKIGGNGTIAQWSLFQQDSSLVGWTAGIEQLWRTNSIEFARLDTWPDAVAYALPQPDFTSGVPQIQVAAFIVSDGQPLAVSLTGTGTYGTLDALRQDGLYDAFERMVKSARAIAEDPNIVNPPLD